MSTTQAIRAGDPHSFTDTEFFERERERVLRAGWACIAHEAQVPKAGDFITADLFGAPVVTVRGKDGALRVLSNVCAHRGFPVMEGSGNAHVLTCPYHLWAYDLDGALKTAPLIKKGEGPDLSQCKLPSVRFETWQGLVFATLSADTPSLCDQISELTGHVAPHGIDQVRWIGAQTYPSPFNWKILIENFMEAYHHIGPHSTTFQPTNPAHLSKAIMGDQPFALLDMPAAEGHEEPLWAICIYPNTLIAFAPTGPSPFLSWYQMEYLSTDHFELRINMFLNADREMTAEDDKASLALSDLIHQEDIPMCEGVSKGMQSPFATAGILAPLEGPIAHFRAWIDAQMGKTAS